MVWDNAGSNIKLNQGEFINMGPLNGDSAFNVAVQGVTKCYNVFG